MPATILFDQFTDMDEPALLFWERLANCLAKHDLQPVLIHYGQEARPTKIPLIRSLADATGIYSDGMYAKIHTTASKDDIDFVYECANNWGSKVTSDDHASRIANGCKNFATAVLDHHNPALIVLWNGYHLEQSFLRRAAIERGIPVVFMERSPFSGWLVLDDEGILAGSSFGRLKIDDLDPVTESSQRIATDFLEMVATSPTWHEQPGEIGSIHQKLKIPQGRELLTFFGQVEHDTQNFLFNPYFEDNVQAWKWFLEITTQLGDGYHRLGKHHPMSLTPPTAYPRSTVDRSSWRADLPLEAVIQQSQALASINSSAITDSMIVRKPVLFLGGGSYYSGKQIAYEVHPEMSEQAIQQELNAWIFDSRSCAHRANFLRCISHLLNHHMIAIDDKHRDLFGLSLENAALWLARHAKANKSTETKICSTEINDAYLNIYSSRAKLLSRLYGTENELNSTRRTLADFQKNIDELKVAHRKAQAAAHKKEQDITSNQKELEAMRQNLKDKRKALKKKSAQIEKQNKELSLLKSDIRSAEKWQRSWVKRVFHRWRPKNS